MFFWSRKLREAVVVVAEARGVAMRPSVSALSAASLSTVVSGSGSKVPEMPLALSVCAPYRFRWPDVPGIVWL